MSKEIAQTVGGKRIAWLIAIVAAFAVFATLGTQWQTSSAALPAGNIVVSHTTSNPDPGATNAWTATFTFSPSGSVNSNGAGTFVLNFDDDLTYVGVTGTGLVAIDTADCTNSGATNVVTCTTDNLEAWTNGTLIFTFTNPAGSVNIDTPACTPPTEGGTATCTVNTSLYTTEGVQVSPETATNARGVAETYTFTFPTNETCVSGGAVATPRTPSCNASDVVLSPGLTLLSGPTANGQNVTVTVINSSTSSIGGNISLSVLNALNVAFSSEIAAKTYVHGELRHVNDAGLLVVDGSDRPLQEINSNVRGSQHTVCVADDATGLGVLIPQLNAQPSDFINQTPDAYAGGYESVTPQSPTASNIVVFTGDGLTGSDENVGLDGATCVSWYSTGAGDQQLSLDYVGADGVTYTIDWDTDDDGNGGTSPVNDSIVKEWNVLEDSTVSWSGAASGSSTHDGGAGASATIALYLDPSDGKYKWSTGSSISVNDTFNGSHLNSGGQWEYVIGLVGVTWSINATGSTCGVITFPNGSSGVTQLAQVDNTDSSSWGEVSDTTEPEALLADIGDCVVGDVIVINISGSEGPLASGTGLTVTENLTITFVAPPPTQKQVFLAWAGQRVILEHDWRIPPGDWNGDNSSDDSVEYLGNCPWVEGRFYVTYIKGSGPGNFLSGLGAVLNGSDQATVSVSSNEEQNDSEIPSGPQESCISRVLFESEDQGQVDIEAFTVGDGQSTVPTSNVNVTKHAFVVYYMKINTINVSLVTQASKVNHNSSTNPDWTPGNPWDASKDDADNAADWNVSKDILVRGRVTGWFVNSNPSGRAADTSNPLNVLPANRWVMPNDWPLLAGGPADPADGSNAIGTAEQFRPYYDIMFAPNSGIALGKPNGTSGVDTALTSLAKAITSTSSTSVWVVDATEFPVNSYILIDSECMKVTARDFDADGTMDKLTVTRGTACAAGNTTTAATHAAGAGVAIVNVTGVPFEGPYSLLDIPGLAVSGFGGAALSDIAADNIRDTILQDHDVDWWDAPMPPAPASVQLRGTGFIKQVLKRDVYFLGAASASNSELAQLFPNGFYYSDIPDSPFIPAIVVGGGYFWDTWGNDGPGSVRSIAGTGTGNGDGSYQFWEPALVGTNSAGFGDTFSQADENELDLIRYYYNDGTIARDLVVYTDNHGEFMVAANGDYKTDLTACTTNVLAGGKHCKTGDKVGTGTITATVDYPDFRGKHFPVLSNAATVTWTWGGYKDVTVENGETDQYKYIVFHAMDRDGFCSPVGTGAVLLHSVLGVASIYSGISDDLDTAFTIANLTGSSPSNARYYNDPNENVDFLIDSGEGIIIGQSGGGTINDGKQFATAVPTFSTAENDPATSGIKEFGLSALAATGAADECQAWIKVSNSLLGILNVLAIAHDDEGNIGFDKIIDLTNTTSYTLNFRWSLVTWAGADAISVSDAIKGTGTSGKNPGGNDISASVTAIYGWDAAAQQWLGYFPSGVNVPGANDLVSLKTGSAFWIAITGPSSVTWTIASNVN